MSEPAPYFVEITRAASGAQATWIEAKDGVRLRVGIWNARAEMQKGTVFVLPGRTEYIEKYAPLATDLAAFGLTAIAIDWRGQGLSDRLDSDPLIGHVEHFTDYQLDVAAMISHGQNLPKPWFLLGHSMGGAIGLRTLMERSDFAAAAFSGPMWGIQTSDFMRPLMWGLCRASRVLGFAKRYPPTTTGPKSYILSEPFKSNGLTRDADTYQLMREQLTAHPELQLGAPSLQWLHEALMDTKDLAGQPSPNIRCFTIMGSEEGIVDVDRVKARMDAWPGSSLHIEQGGRHELLMEDADTRARLTDRIAQHFLSV